MGYKNFKKRSGFRSAYLSGKRNKRGISVLIAWILLILLTVSIGAAVYSWIRDYSKQTTESISQNNDEANCESAALSIVDICQTPSFVYVDLRNQKNLKIEGISVDLITLYDKVIDFRLNKTLMVGRTERFEIPKQGTIKRVKITPFIKVNNNFVCCVGSSTSTEDIKYC